MPAACATLVSKGVGFADSDEVIGLEDAAGVLSLDELKAVAKDAKCAGTNKAQMISGLRKASRQSGLQGSDGQLKLSFDARGNHVGREQHFVKRILKITGMPTKWDFVLGLPGGLGRNGGFGLISCRLLYKALFSRDDALQPCPPRLLQIHGMEREISYNRNPLAHHEAHLPKLHRLPNVQHISDTAGAP